MTANATRNRRPAPLVPVPLNPPLARPSRLLLGARPGTLTRSQERIRDQALHRLTAQEASEILTLAGEAALGRMHAQAHGLVVQTASAVVGRTEALPPGTLRQVIDEWNAAQLPAYKRHMLGVLEAGAFAVAETIEQPFDEVAETPVVGFWQRWFGDPRSRG